MPKNSPTQNAARRVAMAGVLGGLALMLLLGGSALPIATFSAPIFASLCLVPLCEELGGRTALTAYGAVSLLALLLVSDRELALLFVLLCGYYPVLQPRIKRLRSRVLRVVLRLLLCNAALALVYLLVFTLFLTPQLAAEMAEGSPLYWLALVGMGNVLFMLYDALIDKVRFLYRVRFRKYFFR